MSHFKQNLSFKFTSNSYLSSSGLGLCFNQIKNMLIKFTFACALLENKETKPILSLSLNQ
jgi:hypothetical protein